VAPNGSDAVNPRDRIALLCWHRDVNCYDCRGLLELLVRDYSTREGVTRPGMRRLMGRSGHGQRWVTTHLRHLEDDGHVVVKSRGRYGGGSDERATEYLVPWLSSIHTGSGRPKRARTGSSTRSSARSGTGTRTPLSVLRTERDTNDAATAPAQGGSVVVRRMGAVGGPNGDESADPCGVCDGTGWVEHDDGWVPCPTCRPSTKETPRKGNR
jgi:hypothetical protein